MPNETKRRWVDNEAKQQPVTKKRKEIERKEKKTPKTEECHCALLHLSKLIVILNCFCFVFESYDFRDLRLAIYWNAFPWLFFGFRSHNYNNNGITNNVKGQKKTIPKKMTHEPWIHHNNKWKCVLLAEIFISNDTWIKTVFFSCETKRKRKRKKKKKKNHPMNRVHVHNK